jgi:putative transcriptional regulator
MNALGKITSHEIKLFVGYSGWVSKQLDGELARNSWLVAGIKSKQVMESNPDKLWKESLKKLGKEYAYWSNFPSDPIMN